MLYVAAAVNADITKDRYQFYISNEFPLSHHLGPGDNAHKEKLLVHTSASKKFHPKVRNHGEAPTRAFSWLKVATTAFTFKTLSRHYAKQKLTPRSLNMKLGLRRNYHEGRAVWLA